MILLESLTKLFPGQATPAVDRLSLEVPAGQTCVLIGPSGCGKTTTMKMINRLVEPTGGRIVLAGEDVTGMDPVALRRRMGYVIQQIGLFPHLTIGENIATVPRLLGWPAPRIGARVDELLTLVGMDPAIHRARYPRELSGGQRQRVGVARALAGDPPVMLMDEPFGAIDPITRLRLQNEFLRILRTIRKTVVFVTHDVDEAIKMGDRIAILRDGRLVQYGTPDDILAHPANGFVEEFVGADRALKRLDLVTVREVMQADSGAPTLPAGASIRHDATAKEALSAMLAMDQEGLRVVDANGRLVGLVSLSGIRRLIAGTTTLPA
ncbi:MAG: ABC transporter ATP-binding protein [candidate division NC10 bacterium]|nr:ABC transporter ATP-binding protein [candidate division NC10 bacterium]MBI2164419.1 ABC transporter ATP-binding protein [candidate division NC10 bacterium]MBI2457272.1 ABC transporter ATP-binding protein [candidate division NC10 bacterium]MBI3121441.1 ABC transporter ATP-binding protein [candidate division NC10 bacterium]